MWLYVSVAALGSTTGHASETNNNAISNSAISHVVSQFGYDPRWLNLLHVSPHRGAYKSYIDDRDFFLTQAKSLDPAQELAATINAFMRDPGSRCRFTGRDHWLKEVAPALAAKLPAANCDKYLQWLNSVDAQKIVLVFAASYLNSPSSMYGHTLLRVDAGRAQQQSPYLSQALNFAASVNSDDNSFLYSFKGLVGGYPGLFSMMPYHQKIKEYSRLENRDLWEYSLNLNRQEIQRLLAHVWELERIEFDYFFFDENCSFRLLELLEVARPGVELTNGFEWYAIPVDTVRAIVREGLVDDVEMRSSAQRKLVRNIARLTPAERDIVVDTVERRQDTQLIEDSPVSRSGLLAATASEFWRYKYGAMARDAKNPELQLELLRLVNRSELPAAPVESLPEARHARQPESGHKTELFGVALGVEDDDFYTQVEWRISYHDLLDNGAGYPDNLSLSLGRVQLRFADDGASSLQRLDLIDITSLAPRDKFFKPVSWRVNAGLERPLMPGTPLVTQLSGGGGVTGRAGRDLSYFALVNGRVEYSSDKRHDFDLAAGFSAGILGAFERSKLLISLEQWQFARGDERYGLRFSYNQVLSTNHALRLNWRHSWFGSQEFDELELGYRLYF